MRILGGIIALKQVALVALLTGVVIATSGCAAGAKSHGRVASANLPDSAYIGSQPPNANTVYGMARLLRSQGKVAQAELVLLNLQRKYPTFSPTYNDLAEIRMSHKRFEEAVAYLNQGLAIAPNDVVLLNNAGVCALLKQDPEAALAYFQKASAIAPYQARYRANVALALGLNGQYESSRTLFGQIVSKKDADFNAQLIRNMTKPAVVQEVALVAPLDAPHVEAEVEAHEAAIIQDVALVAPLDAPHVEAEVEAHEAAIIQDVAPVAPLDAPHINAEVEAHEAAVIQDVAPVAPLDAPHINAEVEARNAAVVQEMALVAPLDTSYEPAEVEAQETAVPEAVAEVNPAESVEPAAKAAALVELFTNSDVEAHEQEIASIKALSDVEEDVDAPFGFELEEVKPEIADIEEARDPSQFGKEDAGVEVDTAAEADAGITATEDALVAFAAMTVNAVAGDSPALVLEVVEPEQLHLVPAPILEDRPWVKSEYLLPVNSTDVVDSADVHGSSDEESSVNTATTD